MSFVLDAFYRLVHRYPGGAKALSTRLDKAWTTLCHELTGTGSAKLSLVTAVEITQLTGDLSGLNAFAAQCGCLVLPLPDGVGQGSTTFEALAVAAREFGEFVGSVADAAQDGRVTANELERVDRELAEMVVAAQGLRGLLAEMHEAGKPARLRAAA